jgi:hypothetical protein
MIQSFDIPSVFALFGCKHTFRKSRTHQNSSSRKVYKYIIFTDQEYKAPQITHKMSKVRAETKMQLLLVLEKSINNNPVCFDIL